LPEGININPSDLITKLKHLVSKYVYDKDLRNELLHEIDLMSYNDLGVKGIVAEIKQHGKEMDSFDSLILKEIVFNYC
jgi:hypothetical protein